MAVTVLTEFEDFGNRSNTGAEWAGVLNPPTDVNFDTGTITTAASGNGVTFKAALTDTGVLQSDVISSVVVEFDFVLTSSDAAGGLRGRNPTAAGDTYPTMTVPSNAGAAADILGSTSGHCEIELLPDFWGTATITREELFFLVAGGTNARWWTFVINSRHSGAFAAFDVRLQISNFQVTVTDDTPDAAVTSVAPARGLTSGGETVTIRGIGFDRGLITSAPTFGGTAATSYTIISDTELQAVTPAHSSGVFDVVVPGIGTLTDGFRFILVIPPVPDPPYRSPMLQGQGIVGPEWIKWYLEVKRAIEAAPVISSEQITGGTLDPDLIPELPWTRINKDGSSLADLETRSASDLNAGTLKAIRGGTGFSAYTIGDLLYADTALTLAKLADVSAGSYLRSGGAGVAPLWSTLKLPNAANAGDILFATGANSYASQSPAALTKTDDTNVTLTLGGTPATALIKAASITVGWTGTLAVARGGTGTGTAFTTGSVIFAGASGTYSQDNANLFWDDTNNRLGIGTTSPQQAIDITGKIALSGTVVGYLPNQTSFSGTLIYGTGGASLTHGSGSEGFQNTFVGLSAGLSLTTGFNNTAVGFDSLKTATTGIWNTAIGLRAMQVFTTGSENTAVGAEALLGSSSTGVQNTACGTMAARNITSGELNTAVGYQALKASTDAFYNSAVGSNALLSNTSGSFNVAVGMQSLHSKTTGDGNTALGTYALRENASGANNVAVGYRAGYGVASNANSDNTLLGARAGEALTTGSNNILIGFQAGDNLTSGGTNIIIGYNLNAASATGSNQLSIGDAITGDLSTKAIAFAATARLKGYTVATLPAGTQGDCAFVTDATAPAFLTALVGGGAVVAPAFYDGTNWVAI